MKIVTDTAKVLDFVAPLGRENLAGRVYEELRTALFEGRMRPGQRLKIRDLAGAMGVSETPVREAGGAATRVGNKGDTPQACAKGRRLGQCLKPKTMSDEMS